MDAAARLLERNGTAAEKFCHFARYQNDDKATEVIASLLPGEHIEIPLEFTVSHEVYLMFMRLPAHFEGDFDSLEDFEAALFDAALDYDNLGAIHFADWTVSLDSGKFHNSNEISLKLLGELSNGPHKSIARLATFFIARRKEEEIKKIKKEEQRQKQIVANKRGLARREIENECYLRFIANAGGHYYDAWVTYNAAIECSNRKDFAAAIQSNPFRSVMFFAHDHSVRTQPDFNRALERLTNKELRRIAVELYAKNFH